MSIWSGLLAIGALLGANAFFVAAEFSLVAVDRARIDASSSSVDGRARRVGRLQESLTRHLSGAQFGITISALLLGFVAEPIVARLLTGETHATGLSVVLAIGIATGLHLVVAEQVPKYVALAIPERVVLALAPGVSAYGAVTRPLVSLLNRIANSAVRKLGIEPRDQIRASRTLDGLEDLIESSAGGGSLDPEEVTLLRRSIRFADKTAADALVPRVAVEALHQVMHAEAAGPRPPVRQRGTAGLEIHRLPRRAPVHPAQPADAGELVVGDLPSVAAGDERILGVIIEGVDVRHRPAAAPRPIPLVDQPKVAGRPRRVGRPQVNHVVGAETVGDDRVCQVVDGVVDEWVIGLP